MNKAPFRNPVLAAAVTLMLAGSSGAFAYDEDSAIRDCEKRLSSEYKLNDFRHQTAELVPGGGHKYIVKGETKIDGKKYPFGCNIDDRHVTSIKYDGPEPEGLGTAEKLAIGTAAAVAAGAAVSALSKEEKIEVTPDGLKACRDAVGKKSEYRSVSAADIFVTAKEHDDANVEWRIETDSLNDWGTCQVSAEQTVGAVKTKQHEKK